MNKALRGLKTRIPLFLLLASSVLVFLPSVKALNVSTEAVRANEVWSSGNKGADINVAVIDSGIDFNHADFPPEAIRASWNFPNNNATRALDVDGHGTHVAGIVAGRGVVNSAYKGVAWESRLVVVRIDSSYDLAGAINWVKDNKDTYNIKVLSLSAVAPYYPTGEEGMSEYSKAVDNAIDEGIVVVISAGNEGVRGSKTIVTPGDSFNAITVGAIDDNNTAGISDDTLWERSSRGPTGDGRPKPDVVAPGVHIISCRATNTSIMNRDWGDDYIDDNYVEATGTSFAAPHVAGIVALMLHANPNLKPAQVKAILRQTARLTYNLREGLTINDRGYEIVDAYAAVQMAQNVANIDKEYMFDSWEVETPKRPFGPHGETDDYLKFRVSSPSFGYGIGAYWVNYHFKSGSQTYQYSLLNVISAQHVWINSVYYDLGMDMNKYLFSAPRVYNKSEGCVWMGAAYRVNNVLVWYQLKMDVDELWLKLVFLGGSSPYKVLIRIDPNLWDASNYPHLPSSNSTILYECKIFGDHLLDIRKEGRPEHLQIDPHVADNPLMWILTSGYYGNDPNSVLNSGYVYNRDIVIFYQASSYMPDPGPNIYRKPNPPVTPNTNQNDAATGSDAGNNFTDASSIDFSGSYNGILAYSDPQDTKDWYKFNVENGKTINLTLSPPSDIDFDLKLYDPNGNLKAASYQGAGEEDTVSYTTDTAGYWRAEVYINSGEALYFFDASIESSHGGGGCPILHVYNGSEYVSEGLLDIHDPDGIDVVTNHTLVTKPKRVNGEYLFRLTEHPKTISHIDQVRLYAILKDKTLMELQLNWAVHSEYGNVLQQILLSDEWKTCTLGADWNNGTSQSIDLKFQALPRNIKAIGFIFQIEGNNMIEK